MRLFVSTLLISCLQYHIPIFFYKLKISRYKCDYIIIGHQQLLAFGTVTVIFHMPQCIETLKNIISCGRQHFWEAKYKYFFIKNFIEVYSYLSLLWQISIDLVDGLESTANMLLTKPMMTKSTDMNAVTQTTADEDYWYQCLTIDLVLMILDKQFDPCKAPTLYTMPWFNVNQFIYRLTQNKRVQRIHMALLLGSIYVHLRSISIIKVN